MSTRKGGYILSIDEYTAWAKLRDWLNAGAILADEIHQMIQTEGKKRDTPNPTQRIDYDISKISWSEPKKTTDDKGKEVTTWYADANTNKDNADFKKLWTAIEEVKKIKNSPWFWTKMPEGRRGYCWVDQSGNGIYRRMKA